MARKADNTNYDLMKQGILDTCDRIKVDIDNIMKNLMQKQTTELVITIHISPEKVPSYTECYYRVGLNVDKFIEKQNNYSLKVEK